jgi:hypothetical protein
MKKPEDWTDGLAEFFEDLPRRLSWMIADADGTYRKAKIEADVCYEKQQLLAEAIKAEGVAEAKGIREMNNALAGSGGEAFVKLLTERLVRFFPSFLCKIGVLQRPDDPQTGRHIAVVGRIGPTVDFRVLQRLVGGLQQDQRLCNVSGQFGIGGSACGKRPFRVKAGAVDELEAILDFVDNAEGIQIDFTLVGHSLQCIGSHRAHIGMPFQYRHDHIVVGAPFVESGTVPFRVDTAFLEQSQRHVGAAEGRKLDAHEAFSADILQIVYPAVFSDEDNPTEFIQGKDAFLVDHGCDGLQAVFFLETGIES